MIQSTIKISGELNRKKLSSSGRVSLMNAGLLFSIIRLSKIGDVEIKETYRTDTQYKRLIEYTKTYEGAMESLYKKTIPSYYQEINVDIETIPVLEFITTIDTPKDIQLHTLLSKINKSLLENEIIEVNLLDDTIKSNVRSTKELSLVIL